MLFSRYSFSEKIKGIKTGIPEEGGKQKEDNEFAKAGKSFRGWVNKRKSKSNQKDTNPPYIGFDGVKVFFTKTA
jgi:hypothetical protein